MKLRIALLAALSLASLATPVAAAGTQCNEDAGAIAAVRFVATGIIDADNARDIERVLLFYAPDAILMPPAEKPVSGVDAIRARYATLFATFDPGIEGRVEEVCVSGRVAFVRGHNGGRLVGKGAKTSRTLDDVYVMLLRREPAGSWRITHLIWHGASRARQ